MNLTELGNGKYQVIVSCGKDSSGKRLRKRETFNAKNKTEARKYALEFENRIKNTNKTTLSKQELTFQNLVQEWWPHEVTRIKEKTRTRYCKILDTSILPYFGHIKLKDITTVDIDNYTKFVSELVYKKGKDGKECKYSTTTIRHYFNLLNLIFEQAMAWKWIIENPCTYANRPKRAQVEKKALTLKEINTLIESLDHTIPQHRLFILTTLLTGCRRSEVLGIQWNDLDLDNKTLTLRRTVHYTSAKGVYVQPYLKNGGVIRVVALPNNLVKLIRDFKAQLDVYHETYYIFQGEGPSNNTLHPDSMTTWLRRYIKEHNLPKISLHELRHTSVTTLITNGINPHTVASRHGHTVDVAMNVYTHSTLLQQTQITELLDNLYTF